MAGQFNFQGRTFTDYIEFLEFVDNDAEYNLTNEEKMLQFQKQLEQNEHDNSFYVPEDTPPLTTTLRESFPNLLVLGREKEDVVPPPVIPEEDEEEIFEPTPYSLEQFESPSNHLAASSLPEPSIEETPVDNIGDRESLKQPQFHDGSDELPPEEQPIISLAPTLPSPPKSTESPALPPSQPNFLQLIAEQEKREKERLKIQAELHQKELERQRKQMEEEEKVRKQKEEQERTEKEARKQEEKRKREGEKQAEANQQEELRHKEIQKQEDMRKEKQRLQQMDLDLQRQEIQRQQQAILKQQQEIKRQQDAQIEAQKQDLQRQQEQKQQEAKRQEELRRQQETKKQAELKQQQKKPDYPPPPVPKPQQQLGTSHWEQHYLQPAPDLQQDSEPFNKLQVITEENTTLKKNIELLEIRINSMKAIVDIQEREMLSCKADNVSKEEWESRLVVRWRKKVFSMLIQHQTEALTSSESVRKTQIKSTELLEKVEETKLQTKVLEQKLQATKAELEHRTASEKFSSGALTKLEKHEKQLMVTLNSERQSAKLTQSVLLRFAKDYFLDWENKVKLSLANLSSFSQRLIFALSRLQLLKSVLHHKELHYQNSLQNIMSGTQQLKAPKQQRIPSLQNVAESVEESDLSKDMQVKDREIMKLMAERDYLMKKAQEEALTFNERAMNVRNEFAMELEGKKREAEILKEELKTLNFELTKQSQRVKQAEHRQAEVQMELENSKMELKKLNEFITEEKAKSLADLRASIRKCMVENQDREDKLKADLSEAKRDLAKSVVTVRQMERELTRQREEAQESNTTTVQALEEQLHVKDDMISSLKKERKILLGTVQRLEKALINAQVGGGKATEDIPRQQRVERPPKEEISKPRRSYDNNIDRSFEREQERHEPLPARKELHRQSSFNSDYAHQAYSPQPSPTSYHHPVHLAALPSNSSHPSSRSPSPRPSSAPSYPLYPSSFPSFYPHTSVSPTPYQQHVSPPPSRMQTDTPELNILHQLEGMAAQLIESEDEDSVI